MVQKLCDPNGLQTNFRFMSFQFLQSRRPLLWEGAAQRFIWCKSCDRPACRVVGLFSALSGCTSCVAPMPWKAMSGWEKQQRRAKVQWREQQNTRIPISRQNSFADALFLESSHSVVLCLLSALPTAPPKNPCSMPHLRAKISLNSGS